MAERIDVGITIKGADKAAQQVDKVDDSTKALGDTIGGATGALDQMSGGALTAFTGMVSGAKKGALAMKTLRGALISTGIGAIVVAVGALVAYFTSTERGAKQLEVAMAGLGIVFDKIVDVLAFVGENLIGAFSEPEAAIDGFKENMTKVWNMIKKVGNLIKTGFVLTLLKLKEGFISAGIAATKFFTAGLADTSGMEAALEAVQEDIDATKESIKETAQEIAEPFVEAWNVAKEAVIGFVEEVTVAVSAATALQKRSQALRESQRNLQLAFAEGRAQIKEYNMTAEDTTKTLEERLEAAQKAIDIEKELMSERQRIAEEELAIHQEQMALSESTEEDRQKAVDLEVALINIRTESAEMQTTLNNKLNIIKNQAAAEDQKRMDDFLQGLNDVADAEEEAHKEALKRAKERATVEKATADAIRAARQKLIGSAFEALGAMAKTEEQQKKLAIAQILVNQGIALSNAIAGAQASAAATGPGAIFTAPGFTATLVGIVLSGFASIKGVMNQAGAATEGLDTTMPTTGGGGGGGGGGSSANPQLALTPDLAQSFNAALGSAAVQAYVIQQDIADADALASTLQSQASLGGG
tara:strand:- start:356 stop:2116 length:1761 start_codon:yes stop_codon:yes gene_type:complete